MLKKVASGVLDAFVLTYLAYTSPAQLPAALLDEPF
jgi:hypothetical protein